MDLKGLDSSRMTAEVLMGETLPEDFFFVAMCYMPTEKPELCILNPILPILQFSRTQHALIQKFASHES